MERLSASRTSSLAPEEFARLCLNEGAVGVVKPIIRPSRDPCLTPVASYSPPHAEGRTSTDRQLQDGAGLYYVAQQDFSQPAVTGTFSGNSGCVMAEHWGYITATAAARVPVPLRGSRAGAALHLNARSTHAAGPQTSAALCPQSQRATAIQQCAARAG